MTEIHVEENGPKYKKISIPGSEQEVIEVSPGCRLTVYGANGREGSSYTVVELDSLQLSTLVATALLGYIRVIPADPSRGIAPAWLNVSGLRVTEANLSGSLNDRREYRVRQELPKSYEYPAPRVGLYPNSNLNELLFRLFQCLSSFFNQERHE